MKPTQYVSASCQRSYVPIEYRVIRPTANGLDNWTSALKSLLRQVHGLIETSNRKHELTMRNVKMFSLMALQPTNDLPRCHSRAHTLHNA